MRQPVAEGSTGRLSMKALFDLGSSVSETLRVASHHTWNLPGNAMFAGVMAQNLSKNRLHSHCKTTQQD